MVVLDDATVTPAQVEAQSIGFVSYSVGRSVPAVDALDDVEVPVWVGRPVYFDDFDLTREPRSQYGTKPGNTLTIEDETHPAAAGRTGTVVIQGASKKVSFGVPTPEAAVVATSTGDASVFTVETGDQLASGDPAPSCRMTFPVVANAAATYTADGWAMFDAAPTRSTSSCTARLPR